MLDIDITRWAIIVAYFALTVFAITTAIASPKGGALRRIVTWIVPLCGMWGSFYLALALGVTVSLSSFVVYWSRVNNLLTIAVLALVVQTIQFRGQ